MHFTKCFSSGIGSRDSRVAILHTPIDTKPQNKVKKQNFLWLVIVHPARWLRVVSVIRGLRSKLWPYNELPSFLFSGVNGTGAGPLAANHPLREGFLAFIDFWDEEATELLFLELPCLLFSQIFVFGWIFKEPDVNFGACSSLHVSNVWGQRGMMGKLHWVLQVIHEMRWLFQMQDCALASLVELPLVLREIQVMRNILGWVHYYEIFLGTPALGQGWR